MCTGKTDALKMKFLCVNQATYYLPSCDQQTPSGKLYFKVVNLNNKRRRMGDTNGTKLVKVSRNANSTDLSSLDDLEDGEILVHLNLHVVHCYFSGHILCL